MAGGGGGEAAPAPGSSFHGSFGSPVPKKKARIEIIPLIDIMFFLLASFMMVSLSQTTMKGMKVDLPLGSSGQTQNKADYVSYSIDKDGFLYSDKVRINYEDVIPELRQLYTTNPEAQIFIRGDRETMHGNVTRLLDQIRATGYNKISFEIKSQALSGVPGPGSVPAPR
jgi:biopolymer transport protein ExbD